MIVDILSDLHLDFYFKPHYLALGRVDICDTIMSI